MFKFDIYLSDRAIYDRKFYSEEASHSLEALKKALNQFTSIENFIKLTCSPQNWEIKRLKCKLMAWRHHDGHFRSVFTTSTVWGESSPAFIVLRVAPRSVVYQGLDHYLDIDDSIVDLFKNYNPNDEDSFLDEQQPEERIFYRYTETEQGQDHKYNKGSRLQIHQLRGAAGTGKSTSVFRLAIKAVNQGVYPIVVVPNTSLQSFGTTFAQEQKLEICTKLTNLNDQTRSDLAILTKEHLLQHLAGDTHESWSNTVGNIKIRQILQEKRVAIPQYLENINLYSLYLGIKLDDYYQHTSKDLLLQELENLGAVRFIENEDYNHFFQKILEGKDAIVQAQQAQGNWLKFIEVMTQLLASSTDQNTNFTKSPILMIDEIQDFYWSQIKAILNFYRVRFPMETGKTFSNFSIFYDESDELRLTAQSVSQDAGRLVIFAGDNNQRVTFTGFSWSNLATTFNRDFPNYEPFKTPVAFKQNYRNTSQITLAANYILSAQGTEPKAFEINTQGTSWIEAPPGPETCKTQGEKPRLIEADEQWIKKLIGSLTNLGFQTNIEQNERIVLIYNEASYQDESLWASMREICEPINYLMCLSVAEAKGQEFDSVVIIYPFARCPDHPSINELFNWYTALTRAKSYVAILISPREKNWLDEKVINVDDVEKIFCRQKIQEEDDLSMVVDEIYVHGRSKRNGKQIIDDHVTNIFNNIQRRLQNTSTSNNLLIKINNVWEILDALEVSELRKQQNLDFIIFQHFTLKDFDAKEALVIYVALLPVLLELENYEPEFDSQLIEKLEKYFTKNSQELEIALDLVTEPISLCLIYRASQQSWKAATSIKKCSNNLVTQFLYQQINQDLIKRGLPWDATRFRYHYLKEKPIEPLPFQELIEQFYDITDVLINYLHDEISKFSIQLINELRVLFHD